MPYCKALIFGWGIGPHLFSWKSQLEMDFFEVWLHCTWFLVLKYTSISTYNPSSSGIGHLFISSKCLEPIRTLPSGHDRKNKSVQNKIDRTNSHGDKESHFYFGEQSMKDMWVPFYIQVRQLMLEYHLHREIIQISNFNARVAYLTKYFFAPCAA